MVDEDIFLNFIGMIFESIILILAATILILILQKYLVKRHKLTRLLLFIFTNYFIAILFSWISKIFVFTQLNLDNYFYNIVKDFRISEFFVIIAIFLSYILKVNVFEKGYKTIQKYIVIIYGAFACFFVLVFYKDIITFINSDLLDTFAFLIVFIYMVMIYTPFLRRSIQSYRAVDEKAYKQAFLSLVIMSISFMFIFLSFAIDRVTIFMGGPGFTVFYYLAWISAIVGIFGAYYGYIRPKARE
ncbi:MAG: hypothetical protein ACFE9Z_11725 [Promethearchaeota archaeon]